jgi:hypothetical protein
MKETTSECFEYSRLCNSNILEVFEGINLTFFTYRTVSLHTGVHTNVHSGVYAGVHARVHAAVYAAVHAVVYARAYARVYASAHAVYMPVYMLVFMHVYIPVYMLVYMLCTCWCTYHLFPSSLMVNQNKLECFLSGQYFPVSLKFVDKVSRIQLETSIVLFTKVCYYQILNQGILKGEVSLYR